MEKINFENLTREQAVAIVGEDWVKAVETENAEFERNANLDDDKCEIWYGKIQFNKGAYVDFGDESFQQIKAVYYQVSTVYDGENEIDLGSLDWEIDHFELD